MTEYRIAFIDDGNRRLKTYLFNGATWSVIGSDLLLSTGVTSEMVMIGKDLIALTDSANQFITAYSFRGQEWNQRGQQNPVNFTFATMALVHPHRLSILGYDVSISDYPIRVYDFNKIIFSRVGNEFIVSTGTGHDSTGMDIYTIAFVDDSSNELRRLVFNGTVFAQVGTPLTISGMTNPVIAALSSTRIALFDEGNAKLQAYDWNGSTFVPVGSALTISGCSYACIDAISSSKIAFIDDNNQELRVYSFSGSAWSLTGTPLPISCSYPKFTAFFKPIALECYNEVPVDGKAIWPISN